MTAQTVIVVANQCGAPKGQPLFIANTSHKFSHKESMDEHIRSGGIIKDWSRAFSHIYINDKTPSELQWVLEPYMLSGTTEETINGTRFNFIEPDKESGLYVSLFNTGKAESTWAVASQFLIERK